MDVGRNATPTELNPKIEPHLTALHLQLECKHACLSLISSLRQDIKRPASLFLLCVHRSTGARSHLFISVKHITLKITFSPLRSSLICIIVKRENGLGACLISNRETGKDQEEIGKHQTGVGCSATDPDGPNGYWVSSIAYLCFRVTLPAGDMTLSCSPSHPITSVASRKNPKQDARLW